MKFIRLLRRNGSVRAIATVDDKDYWSLVKYKWHLLGEKYAARTEHTDSGKRMVYMHRQIMNPPDGMDVDHKNHNRLDNRRDNLRVCTRSDNLKNKEAHGVYRRKSGTWRARITVDGQVKSIGTFKTRALAEAARREAARIAYGEFAYARLY